LERILDTIEKFLDGFLDGLQGLIDQIVRAIESIQARIHQLQALLETIRAYLARLRDFRLPSAAGLVAVGDGTVGLLNEFLAATNKPEDGAEAYSAGVVLVAGGLNGYLLSILTALFGGGSLPAAPSISVNFQAPPALPSFPDADP
jgi:ABC-type transporter Mla subunit MlaD